MSGLDVWCAENAGQLMELEPRREAIIIAAPMPCAIIALHELTAMTAIGLFVACVLFRRVERAMVRRRGDAG